VDNPVRQLQQNPIGARGLSSESRACDAGAIWQLEHALNRRKPLAGTQLPIGTNRGDNCANVTRLGVKVRRAASHEPAIGAVPLYDVRLLEFTNDTTVRTFANAGSQCWLQIAVNRKPQLLLSALRRSGAIGPRASVTWHSPLESDEFREYRDRAALAKAGITDLKKPLDSFWPARGPIGMRSESRPTVPPCSSKPRRTFLKRFASHEGVGGLP
jgi:hypothetical protein